MHLGVDDVAAQPIGFGLNNLQSASATGLILRALAGKGGNAEGPIVLFEGPTISRASRIPFEATMGFVRRFLSTRYL
jgi:hypothetical protein